MGRRESGDYQNSAFCSLWAMAVSAPNLGSTMIFTYSVFLLNSWKEKKKKKNLKKEKHLNWFGDCLSDTKGNEINKV